MDIYLVGGAVRDALMGLPVHDRDWVVVGSTPEAMTAQGFVAVGRDFPVFLHPTTHEEYALARTERKTAPGHQGFAVHAAPDVTLAQDLARRDLTINSIAAQALDIRASDTKHLEKADFPALIDPHGGQSDIQAKVLRHVTDAFAEDPVRILRLARFAARFPDFSVAPETMALMQHMVAGGEVDALVAERVWQELARALMTAAPQRMLEVLHRCGALPRLLPELAWRWAAPPAEAEPHTASPPLIPAPLSPGSSALAQAAHLQSPLTVRFACLCLDLKDPAALTPLAERLRLPTDCKTLAAALLRERATLDKASTNKVIMGVRPEDLALATEGADMTVTLVEELGADTYVYGTYAGPDGPVDLVARGQGMAAPKIGSVVKVSPTRTYVFDNDGAQLRLS